MTTPTTPTMPSDAASKPTTLAHLIDAGWQSRTVKQELRDNLTVALERDEQLFPGIVGYDDTVIPEIINAILAGHDLLFLGEKGQAKSKLMRLLTQFLDAETPYLDIPGVVVHEDPFNPITSRGKAFLADHAPEDTPVGWWPREQRYAERLAPGTKFADVIGEIDPAKLAQGVSMSTEDALHFGLIPRMHRGVFAMNELPDLDELVQVGLFNILEERDVQIRGYPVSFDIDVMVLFSANPSTYNRSGKVIPQLKDRIGSTIQTHYPRDRDLGIDIMVAEAGLALDGPYPVTVPRFMLEVCEEMARAARQSPYIDHESGVSARFSIANYRTMVSSARQRAIRLKESPAVPRISDLAHFHASAVGKLELDLMGSHQLTERQALDAIAAEAIGNVFDEYVSEHGFGEIAEIFAEGTRIEVSDMLPSEAYAEMLKRVPPVWDKAFEVNASSDPAVRASCVEFVLAGLWARDKVSRSERHGRMEYEM